MQARRGHRRSGVGMLLAGAMALGIVVLGASSGAYGASAPGYTEVSSAPFTEPSALEGSVGQSLAADPFGSYVAVAGLGAGSGTLPDSADLEVTLYSVSATGALTDVTSLSIPTLANSPDRIDSMTFSPNGQELAIALGNPAVVQLVSVDTSASTPTLTEGAMLSFNEGNTQEKESGVTSVAFSPSGPFFAVALGSTQGSLIATYSTSSTPSLIEKVTLPEVDGYAPMPQSLAFNEGGNLLASGLTLDEESPSQSLGAEEGTVALLALDPHTGGELQVLSDTTPTGYRPTAIAFDPQGGILAVGTQPFFESLAGKGVTPGAVWLYHVANPSGSTASLSASTADPIVVAPSSLVSGVMFSPSGQDLTVMIETLTPEGSFTTSLVVDQVGGSSLTPITQLSDGSEYFHRLTAASALGESASGSLIFAIDEVPPTIDTTSAQNLHLVNVWSMGTTLSATGPATAVEGTPVTITAGLAPDLPVGPPGGVVTFASGGTTLCSSVVSGAETAQCTTSKLPVGTDSITASYAAQGGWGPSSASTTVLVTAPVTPSPTTSPSPTPSVPSTHTGEPWAGSWLWYGLDAALGVAGVLLLDRARRGGLARGSRAYAD